MNHVDTNKTLREKARWELDKNATNYFEQILEAIPHETTSVRPLTCNPQNQPSKTNKKSWTLLEKQGPTHKSRSSMDPNVSVFADQ